MGHLRKPILLLWNTFGLYQRHYSTHINDLKVPLLCFYCLCCPVLQGLSVQHHLTWLKSYSLSFQRNLLGHKAEVNYNKQGYVLRIELGENTYKY